jgi:hypothetical protein
MTDVEKKFREEQLKKVRELKNKSKPKPAFITTKNNFNTTKRTGRGR